MDPAYKKRCQMKEEKNTTKNTSRTKKIPMLQLDNNDEIQAKIVYMKDNSKC